MKNTIATTLTAALLAAGPAIAADKILLKTPVAFSTELPGLGTPIVRVSEDLAAISGGAIKMKVYEPGALVSAF